MDRIIALVGESGSGKTTIAKELEKRGYNVIKSYTTRPEREPGEWGHIFGDMDWYFNDTNGDRVIADTFYNNEYYWATKEQYQGKGTSIYIIDPLGTYSLKNKISDAKIIVVYLKTDKEVRYVRMLKRAASSKEPRRLIVKKTRERMEFDKLNFTFIPADYVIDANRYIEDIVYDIERGVISNE